MNSEPKPFASLSSSLLARKGQAKPAMRPQGFAGFGFAASNVQHDDLGWNDMGHEVPAPQPVSAEIVPIHADVQPDAEFEAPVVVHQQQEELARELAPAPALMPVETPAPVRAKVVRAAPGSKGKAAFTLRLDPERHLKLRLVCAVEHRSAQQVVVDALDAFLADRAAVSHLAANVPSKKSR
jgi:hypothetical protein